MKVLVTTCDGAGRTTLSVLRSLARAGAHVTLGGDIFGGEAYYSRFYDKRIFYPHPERDFDGFRDFLIEYLSQGEFDVLLPVTDYTVLAICRFRDEIEPLVGFPFGHTDAIALAQDKYRTLMQAREVGVAIPETHKPENEAELKQVSEIISFPCVLKPRSGSGSKQTYILQNPEELIACYSKLPRQGDMLFDFRPLVQEFIPGQIEDVGAFFCHGETRVLTSQTRLRSNPPNAGMGIDVISTDNADAKNQAELLLRSLDWHGVAEVELKRDARNGKLVLMEINPRLWGGLDLMVQAGADYPLLLAQLAMEGDVEPVNEYRVGLRYRWIQKFDGWTFWNIFRLGRNQMTDFRWLDPLPHFYMLAIWFRGWLRRALRRTRTKVT